MTRESELVNTIYIFIRTSFNYIIVPGWAQTALPKLTEHLTRKIAIEIKPVHRR